MCTLRRWWGRIRFWRVAIALATLGSVLIWRRLLLALLGLFPAFEFDAGAARDIVTVVGLVIAAGQLWLAFFPRRSPPEPKLLLWSSPEDEIARCSDRGKTAWAPRTPNHEGFLAEHPRFCFRDAAGAGKTREALELIRCTSGKPVRGLIVPNWGAPHFESATSQLLEAALDSLELGSGPVALWLDDLHQPLQARSRERIIELLEMLEERLDGQLLVAATSRQDAALGKWQDCLNSHEIAVLSLEALEQGSLRQLADSMAATVGVTLDDDAHAALWGCPDHRPELVRAALQSLASDRITAPTGEQLADRLRRGMAELWQQERRELIRAHPAVAPLLEALALFYAAGQYPDARLVRAVALQRTTDWRQKLALRLGGAEAALLAHPYFDRIEDRLVGAEVALESVWQEEDAARELARFVARYRRLLQRRPLQRLNSLREAQSWLAVGLGIALSEKARALTKLARFDDALPAYDRAIVQYARALQIMPDLCEAAYDWGNALADKAGAMANLEHFDEALVTYDEAFAQYRRAIQIQPRMSTAVGFWGIALTDMADLLASLDRFDEALAAYAKAEAKYDHALRIEPNYHFAALFWGACLQNKAEMLESCSRQWEALDAYRQACQKYKLALQIAPDECGAAFFLACALDYKGELLASLGCHTEAIASYDESEEQLTHVLEIRPDDTAAQDRLEVVRLMRSDLESFRIGTDDSEREALP